MGSYQKYYFLKPYKFIENKSELQGITVQYQHILYLII